MVKCVCRNPSSMAAAVRKPTQPDLFAPKAKEDKRLGVRRLYRQKAIPFDLSMPTFSFWLRDSQCVVGEEQRCPILEQTYAPKIELLSTAL